MEIKYHKSFPFHAYKQQWVYEAWIIDHPYQHIFNQVKWHFREWIKPYCHQLGGHLINVGYVDVTDKQALQIHQLKSKIQEQERLISQLKIQNVLLQLGKSI